MDDKLLDPWSGSLIVQARVGRSLVKFLSLDTKEVVCIHSNDLRDFKRLDTREWKISGSEMKRISAQVDLEFGDFSKGNLKNPWKNREIFVHIADAADLEMAFAKALKEPPKKILMVHYAICVSLVADHPAGFRIWDCCVGCYTLQDLRKVARDSGWVKDLMSGTEGEVLRLDALRRTLRMILFLVMRNSPSILTECSRTSERKLLLQSRAVLAIPINTSFISCIITKINNERDTYSFKALL